MHQNVQLCKSWIIDTNFFHHKDGQEGFMHRLIENYFRNLEELKKESETKIPCYSNTIEEDNEVNT